MSLKNYHGAVKKSAAVFTNDPKQARATLTLQGNVKALVDVNPQSGVAFRGLADQLDERAFDMTSTDKPFHIERVETNLEGKIKYQLEIVEEGKHYRLKVSNALPRGTYSGFVKCITDIPQKPDILIRVSGFIEGDISIRPLTVLVGRLAAQQPVRVGNVAVISNRHKPFTIKQIIFDEKVLKVTQEPIQSGQGGVNLIITPILENIPQGARQQSTLTIVTDASPDEKYDVAVHVLNSAEPPAAPPTTPQPPAKPKPGDQLRQ